LKEDGMTEPLVACHECDLLQREVPVPRGGVVRCVRCNAVLYRSHPDSFERTLALTAGGIVLFAIANSFPLIGLKIQGQLIETTLFQTVQTLWNEDMKSVGMLVFATTMLMPGLQLAALTYLLLPLRVGRAPAHFAIVYRVMQSVRPWGMVEVFMLGVLVSLVKLAHLAGIVPGAALGAFAVLMFVMAAIAAVFDPRDLWARLAAVESTRRAQRHVDDPHGAGVPS
jgi:paraquat-inducible protein A